MKLSRRETYIAVAALGAVLLLAADHYVITPLMESAAALEADQDKVVRQLEEAERLFDRRRMMGRKWQELAAGGLTDDPKEAESRILHAMRDWAEEARLSLTSMKPDRSEESGKVRTITVVAAGTGNMRAVARFLWHVETTDLPLRVHEMQLGARKEGTDDLTLQLKASTLYLGAGPSAGPAEPAGAPQGEEGA